MLFKIRINGSMKYVTINNRKAIKVNILSLGRFHVCDLARELDKNGFDVKFYSFVPTQRTEKFGLPRRCSKSIIGIMAPFLLLERKIFKHSQWIRRVRTVIQDYVTGIYMRRCDVCIAMSGSFLYSLKRAKSGGAIIFLERGSKHILEQKKILDAFLPVNKVSNKYNTAITRELSGYEIADYIAIPSEHVKRSFAVYHYPMEKLFLNPYGVNLSMFHPMKGAEKKYDVIMVGGWSYRKGCDLIIESLRRMNLQFLHVGSIGDLSFPAESNFTHIDSVDESELSKYYNMAKIFLFPSREDGFGMVLSQAMACNLPIVASPDCGGPDLKRMVDDPEYITIIKDYTIESICTAVQTALANYQKLANSIYAGKAIEDLSWDAYGRRYAAFISKKITR